MSRIRFPRFVLILLSVLMALVLAELGLRWWGFVPGFTGAMSGEYLDLKKVERLETYRYFLTDSLGIFRANPDTVFYNDQIRVNRQGFRGREFLPDDSAKKKVLLIGDSFTWGGNADPISNCFADLIEAGGYYTWNAGMPGTEPNQYAKVAELYVPVLKPDFVVVSFYMENDVMFRKWETGPFEQKYHVTNAGWLNPFLDGDYLGSPEQTLDYYFRRFSIPDRENRFLNRLCAKTVLGTRLWMALVKFKWIEPGYDPFVKNRMEKYQKESFPEPVSAEYLGRIQTVCESQGARLLIFLIKSHTRLEANVREEMPALFRGLEFFECDALVREDYNEWPDGHFNNKGHRKFAQCILEKLKTFDQN